MPRFIAQSWWQIIGLLAAGVIVPLAVCCSSASVSAQLPASESIKTLTAPPGYELKVFASEPMVVNPIAMDIDNLGRLWVTEGVNYRRNVNDPPDNKIKVLEDTDHDGVADKVTVFISDLNAAMGICVAGGRIYVPESPNLYVYEDMNNDLVPDGPRKVLLTGFGGKNHDHGLHSCMFGPDHKLYMTQGDTSYDVTGPDGVRINFQWGAMLRCEADGTKLEDFAVNFRNPFELSVDSFGNVWCSDNDNDGLKSVRICWILEGGNYGWFGGPENIRNPDGSFDPIHHWRADKPGFVPYTLITGFGSPCGMTFYEGTSLGEPFMNRVVHCDAGPREVRLYGPQRLSGVGYSATAENIVTGTDGYFRPDDVCTAPDGSIFINDWYDGGVGGHAYNDPERGRIYRLTKTGVKHTRLDSPAPYKTADAAFAALASPNLATQYLARSYFLAEGKNSLPKSATKLVKDVLAGTAEPVTLGAPSDVLAARVVWLADRIAGSSSPLVTDCLKASDPRFRGLAVRILRRYGDKTESTLIAALSDPDSEVFKEALLGVGKLTSAAATAAIIKAYNRYDGSDRYLLETLAIASRGRLDEVFAAVVDSPSAALDPRLVSIARILRPDDATKFFSAKLATGNLPAESKQALLDALSGVSTVDAGRSMLAVVSASRDAGTQLLAIDALARNINGPWSALKTDPEFAAMVLAAIDQPALTISALKLAGDAGLSGTAEHVSRLLQKPDASNEVIIAASELAIRLNLADLSASIAGHLGSRDAAVQAQALRAVVALRDAAAIKGLLLSKSATNEMKSSAIEQLSRSSDGALLLLKWVDEKSLSEPLTEQAIGLAAEHPDVNVRILFEKFIPESQRPRTLGQEFSAADILALEGSSQRGESVFLRSGAASCIRCHRVKNQGADIGPDLSQIGRKYERKALLDTIMNPSAGIAPEYYPYVVETKLGRVYAGFLHEETPSTVTLKTTEGTIVQFPRNDIEELTRQSVSLMPELVLKNVTAQDAADLLAYLVSLQEAVVHAPAFRAIGPFSGDKPESRSKDFGPEATAGKIDFSATHEGVRKELQKWMVVPASTLIDGIPTVDLVKLCEQRNFRTNLVIFYFAVEIESTQPQEAVLKIGSDDGIQVWLNGDKVHDNKVTRALRPGEDVLKVNLKQGRNLVLLKVDQGDGASGVSLSAEARANITIRVP